MVKKIHSHKKENSDMIACFAQMKADNTNMLKALQKALKKARKNKKRRKVDSDSTDSNSE